MRDLICPNCGQHLAFENSVCLSCNSRVGFSLDDMAFLVIAEGQCSEHAGAVDASEYQLCANLRVAECNWLVKVEPIRRLCASCTLTRTRPNDAEGDDVHREAVAAVSDTEVGRRAKQRRSLWRRSRSSVRRV